MLPEFPKERLVQFEEDDVLIKHREKGLPCAFCGVVEAAWIQETLFGKELIIKTKKPYETYFRTFYGKAVIIKTSEGNIKIQAEEFLGPHGWKIGNTTIILPTDKKTKLDPLFLFFNKQNGLTAVFRL